MARDPLLALARLRRLETDAARRRLGEAFARLAAAEQRVADAAAALQAEATAAPADYAAWLRRGLAERDRARLSHGFAETGAATTQAVLAGARAAERGLEALRDAKRQAAASRAARKAQAALDEAAATRPPARRA